VISSAQEFISLRDSGNPEEYARAAHDDAPLQVWKDVIANHPDYAKWVVHNKTVPLEILEELSLSGSAEVRWWVATKRKLSAALFERLAKDSDAGVRTRIALNAKTPSDVPEALCEDRDDGVARAAGRRTGRTCQM